MSDRAELLVALQAFTEKLVPGRWSEVRQPNAKELKGTRVLAMSRDEASAKACTGPPVDDDEDLELDVSAGLMPLGLAAGAPIAHPKLAKGIAPSPVVTRCKPSGS